MKTHIIFGITAVVLIIAFMVGSSYYKGKQAEKIGFMAQENAELFVREHSQTLGSDDAKVYLVEFTDPACETCAAFSPFIKKLMASDPGKIKLVIRYAPFHEGSDYIVKILEAARKQGKYWEALDVMYASQRFWASHHHPQPLQGPGSKKQPKTRLDAVEASITTIIFDAQIQETTEPSCPQADAASQQE